ncbi:hypothetical protein HBI56_080120 [Parastagonospora nodorum]|uniref:Uncharacterized protein n=1 Tax=Phaeosphaeria nodorum (strain SN15 / ATCC MYA-4574 / FGSC 10173) TaxID=321614 RepID=A0A7U2I8J3_PHANO|nr:hypothetical protein HBH56_106610 [Parastagonospora nodorum]QRD04848.1 hypothetical protein JI435_107660 [Parastagonospora nodorum SN15]KAH3929559.1 hypothetical protein HBH54_123820 [Parastagonospora nodorum]KAH3951740.1 hypothetical protein HBH53_057820 [Parastagonospora nodorum]KAH3975624.1 hypothetical protein HBH52_129070 [Parastagonospora nodorum]
MLHKGLDGHDVVYNSRPSGTIDIEWGRLDSPEPIISLPSFFDYRLVAGKSP